MLKVRKSSKKQHIIAGLDLGTIEKNIINKDLGILDLFGDLVKYNPSGRGGETLPHLSFQGKVVYALGYADKARWKKALGSQSGCIYIDEINIADMDFVREASMRCDYLMATLNPDDPGLPVYTEYINHSRPLPEFEIDAPDELNQMLCEEPKPGWVHWFFSFAHNAGLTPTKMAQIIGNVPVGTKLYKNKIQGLRGRATGLIFNVRPENIITPKQAHELKFSQHSCGVDTSYSRNSEDTFTFIFGGVTTDRRWVTLAEQTFNNKDLPVPITPSDVPPLLIKFLEQCRSDWGFGRNVFIDSADQGTILECQKYKKAQGSPYLFQGAWKKTEIIDRINLQAGWMAHEDFLIVDTCKESIRELNLYSWKEDKDEPEDRNDHSINGSQYAWLPFKDRIGQILKEAKG